MKKTKIRIFATLLMTILCFTAFSTTAFAGGSEESTEPATTETPSTPLTPEGNLTLVDDVERTDEIDKQFITAVSKNGNYFYLVIDRAGKEDNVYLLNMVDEADLMALMKDENGKTPAPACNCSDKCETGKVNTACDLCKTDTSRCTGKIAEVTEPTDEPQPEKEKSNPIGILALLLVVGLIGGGAFYYFKVLKNKAKSQSNPNVNEYDFNDDEEDEYEPTPEDITEETTDESEDDVK